jgi:STE24 endopeptidase
MNIYGIIILVTLLLDYVMNLVADIFNLRALRAELPMAFHGVYDAEVYRRSQAYTRVQTQFAWVSSSCMLVVMLLFWFTGGFHVLDQVVRSWQWRPIATGLAYIGLLMLGRMLLACPFRVYATFVIEERFGFNRTTPMTFVKDMVKGLGLAVILGGPLLAGVLAFLQYAGPYAWIYCWVATVLVMLGVQFVAPTWIMPLFNTFQPLEPGPLREALLAYARGVGFPLQDVYVMDGSRRSSKSNAFFTGFGKHKRVALFDTLIAQLTPPELVAVLAHEIGHYKKKHIVQGLLLSIAHMGVMFLLLSLFLHHQGLFQAFYVEQPSIYAGVVFFTLLYTPFTLLLSIGMHVFSRRHEYEADGYAVETFGQPEAMAQALQKLSVQNLSNLTPHPFYVFLHYSHPPVLERIQAIRHTVTPLSPKAVVC